VKTSGLLELSVHHLGNGQLQLPDGRVFLNMCSCSYLGLHNHPALIEGAIQALQQEKTMGMALSTLRVHLAIMDELEARLSELYRARTMVTVSASAASAGVLPLIASGHLTDGKPRVMVFDKFAHFSMAFIKPIVADETMVLTSPHNDMNFLEDVCRKHPRVAYVCDGVYSVGGVTNLQALRTLQEKYGLFLYIDDSHSLSTQGKNGEGYIRSRLPELNDRTLIIASTAKAFGSTGGIAMLGSRRHYDFLYRTGPMGWSQSLRTAAIGTSLGSIKVHRSPELARRQEQLRKNIALFDEHIQTPQRGDGLHIKVVEVGEQDKAVKLSRELYKRGFYCSAVFFPIVPVGRAGIRLMLRGDLPTEMVQSFVDNLKAVLATL
jgi:7-keto-8-aminopelargonate synthetase-like enzyme